MTSSSEGVSRPAPPVPWHRRFPPQVVLGVLGAVTLCDLAFYLLAVRPAALAGRERAAVNARLEREVAATRQRVEALQEVAAGIHAADQQGANLVRDVALPRRSAFSSLLTELEQACSEAGVEIREANYTVDPVEDSEGYGILAVNANFRGDYAQLVQLLFRLDKSELFFIIGSLGTRPRDEGSPGELRITMRFDTLVRDL